MPVIYGTNIKARLFEYIYENSNNTITNIMKVYVVVYNQTLNYSMLLYPHPPTMLRFHKIFKEMSIC